MARIEDIYQPTRDHVVELAGTPLDGEPWVSGTPLARRRVALLTTAALHRRSQARFTPGTAEHRELPSTLPAGELVSSHISINFDRSGLERDLNTIYPLDRLREPSEWPSLRCQSKDASGVCSCSSRYRLLAWRTTC